MNSQPISKISQKVALAIVGVIVPLGTLGASLPASAHDHFFGFGQNQSSKKLSMDNDRINLRINSDNDDERRRHHHFIFIDEHPFERYDVLFRVDDDSPWLKEASYHHRLDAELEVRRLEHKGFIAKLVRE